MARASRWLSQLLEDTFDFKGLSVVSLMWQCPQQLSVYLLLTVDELNSSDSFLTQDTRDSKKLAEERAHEAKLKNETSIKADSENADTQSKDNSNTTQLKEIEENDNDGATEINNAKDES